MRIGLDARTIYWPTRRGTGKNLIDLYRQVSRMQPDWKVLAYHRMIGPAPSLLPQQTVQPRLIEMIGDRFNAWQRLRLPLAARRDGVDVLHCPANTCPSWLPVPTVVTIHDLIPLDMPQGRPAGEVRRFEQAVQTACRRAAGIICPSNYTRDRLLADFHADPQRISVIPWAPDSAMHQLPDEHCHALLRAYGISRPYVLHFGAGAQRKNTARLIDAWALLRRSVRRECQLLVVGLDESMLEAMALTIRRLGIQDSVQLSGFAHEADLPALLSAATALAYPSLSEGFGLPILDAWAVQTPVLTSNTTSLPEVAGDAALLIDPTDPCSIARGLDRMIRDFRLRDELVERSRERIKRFSWQHTANRFIQTMQQAVSHVSFAQMAA